jgi:hypothetical protein
MERGRALIEESIDFGVTHMRAFVEVDSTVGLKCLNAGLELKNEFRDKCYVQICAFAQDPIVSQPDSGQVIMSLMTSAAERPEVEVIGSTPYVENSPETQKNNIIWMISMALVHKKHLDFHLDYNLDVEKDPSDLFMMGRPKEEDRGGQRVRGTLQIPQMIKEFGLQAAVGVNNVGNAFTPHGSCDPLSVVAMGVGLYQAGTKEDAEILLVNSPAIVLRILIPLISGNKRLRHL